MAGKVTSKSGRNGCQSWASHVPWDAGKAGSRSPGVLVRSRVFHWQDAVKIRVNVAEYLPLNRCSA